MRASVIPKPGMESQQTRSRVTHTHHSFSLCSPPPIYDRPSASRHLPSTPRPSLHLSRPPSPLSRAPSPSSRPPSPVNRAPLPARTRSPSPFPSASLLQRTPTYQTSASRSIHLNSSSGLSLYRPRSPFAGQPEAPRPSQPSPSIEDYRKGQLTT